MGNSSQGSGITTSLTKQVSKDCVIYFDNLFYKPYRGITNTESTSTATQHISVKINNVLINVSGLWCGNRLVDSVLDPTGLYKLYIKSGQTLDVIYDGSHAINLTIIPLKSGGSYFFDLTKEFLSGYVSAGNELSFTAPYPVLFTHGYARNVSTMGNNAQTIENKNIYLGRSYETDTGVSQIFLDTGDTYKSSGEDQSISWWAYPLLDDESESCGGSEQPEPEPEPYINGGLEIYDMSNASATDKTKDYYFEEKLGGIGGYKRWRN